MNIKNTKEVAEAILNGDSDNYDGADAARIIIDLCEYIEDLELNTKHRGGAGR